MGSAPVWPRFAPSGPRSVALFDRAIDGKRPRSRNASGRLLDPGVANEQIGEPDPGLAAVQVTQRWQKLLHV